MKIYGLPHNYKTHRILVAAQYAGVDVTVEHFHPSGQSEEVLAEYRKKNPNLLVPTLETPEGYLYETNAIVRHVARSGENSTIYGKNDFEKAQIDQYLDWVTLNLESFVFPIFLAAIGHKTCSKEIFESNFEGLKKLLRIIDDRVKQNKFLVGDSVSIADIAVVTSLTFLFRYFFDEKFRKPFPNLTKYYETIANEENFKKIQGRPFLIKNALQIHGSSN